MCVCVIHMHCKYVYLIVCVCVYIGIYVGWMSVGLCMGVCTCVHACVYIYRNEHICIAWHIWLHCVYIHICAIYKSAHVVGAYDICSHMHNLFMKYMPILTRV